MLSTSILARAFFDIKKNGMSFYTISISTLFFNSFLSILPWIMPRPICTTKSDINLCLFVFSNVSIFIFIMKEYAVYSSFVLLLIHQQVFYYQRLSFRFLFCLLQKTESILCSLNSFSILRSPSLKWLLRSKFPFQLYL